jgi:hypothetical protein
MSKSYTNPYPNLCGFLGWNMQGNLGPWTCYQNAHRKPVWYWTMPQLEPPSPARIHQKDLFRAAAMAWAALSSTTKAAWMAAARAAHLRIHGHNLFMYWWLKRDDAAVKTIERISGETLLGAV